MTLPLLPQYIDPQSILVINGKGLLKKLHCPFGVVTINQIDNIPPLTRMIVEEVKHSLQELLVFIVNGKPYSHRHFKILMQF